MKMQDMLDQEAELSNNGHGDSEERQQLLTFIRLKRVQPAPWCFGEDDCSTEILSMCPWRIDCGT